jgi:hypothetical protein
LLEALCEKLNAARSSAELGKAWFVEQQHIKRAFAPRLWSSLLAQLKDGCELLGRNAGVRLDFSNTISTEARVKNADTALWISLKFDASGPIVWFQTPGPNGHYAFRVDEDGSGIKFLSPKTDSVMFPDELVEEILKHVT